jgi:hypothetical protein
MDTPVQSLSKKPKFILTSHLSHFPFPFLTVIFPIFTWTWWDHFHQHKVSHTFSPLLPEPHAGRKQCHSPQPLPQPVQRLFFLHKYADLAFLTLSFLSVAPNSLLPCGHNSLPSYTFPTSPPQHSTYNPMACWNRARCSSPDRAAHLPWCLLSFRSSHHEQSNSCLTAGSARGVSCLPRG